LDISTLEGETTTLSQNFGHLSPRDAALGPWRTETPNWKLSLSNWQTLASIPYRIFRLPVG